MSMFSHLRQISRTVDVDDTVVTEEGTPEETTPAPNEDIVTNIEQVEDTSTGDLIPENPSEEIPEGVVVTPEPDVEGVVVGQESLITRRALGNLSEHVIQSRAITTQYLGLRRDLSQYQMIVNFENIAKTHSLSAPVVATMRAAPGFVTAVSQFPESSLYNIVPEHATSSRLKVGLESLGEAEVSAVDTLKDSLRTLLATFTGTIGSLSIQIPAMSALITNARADLDGAELGDDIIGTIPVTTLSSEAFEKTLGMIEKYLGDIEDFNTDDLRANPEKISEYIDELVDIVGDLGRIMGLSIDDNGLVETEVDKEFSPSYGTFAEKELTKTTLMFYLDKAATIVDLLKGISDRKDDFISAVSNEVNDIPTSTESDDVTYGSIDHVKLTGCYISLVSKLISETLILVTRLVSAVDHIVDPDTGIES